MKLRPLGNRVVVKPEPIKEKKIGKLIIPETVDSLTNKNFHATVLAVGPGLRNQRTGITIPLEVEPGDVVVLSKYAGSRIYIDRQEIMLIDISEILGVETT